MDEDPNKKPKSLNFIHSGVRVKGLVSTVKFLQ